MQSFVIAGYVWQILKRDDIFGPLIREHPQKCPILNRVNCYTARVLFSAIQLDFNEPLVWQKIKSHSIYLISFPKLRHVYQIAKMLCWIMFKRTKEGSYMAIRWREIIIKKFVSFSLIFPKCLWDMAPVSQYSRKGAMSTFSLQ